MLRPATPLAVVLFLAFALLILSVLSTPIIKVIPLGSYEGINFGVFGFCLADGSCSGVELGYDPASLYSSSASATFDLPASTRHTLSTILILHPVAAFLCLVMLVLAFVAHFHSPAHSVRYLLGVFIVSIFAFLAALLAFLIDILLFVPHMAWGSYITLAAACLIGLGSIVACAMRRTLVSRKTRKHRIEANAEMSGENFYNRQAQEVVTTVVSGGVADGSEAGVARQPTVPQIDQKEATSSEEQIPLTAQTSLPGDSYSQPLISQNQYQYGVRSGSVEPAAMSGASTGPPRLTDRSQSTQRDAYGNVPPYGNAPPLDSYGARRGPVPDAMGNMPPSQRGRGGGPGYRGGRGGGPGPYAQPGRGGYGPAPGRGAYGPPPGRGGYGSPPGRGGYGPPGRAGYGGPMPPYNGRGRGGFGGYGPPPGRGGYPGPGPGRGGRSPPPGYQYESTGSYGNNGQSTGPQVGYYANAAVPNASNGADGNSGAAAVNGQYSHDRSPSADLPRAESPPPLPNDPVFEAPSHAVEMDASVLPSQPHQLSQQQAGRFSDGDSEIAGLVGLQEGRTSRGLPEQQAEAADQYVPPRAHWNTEGAAPSDLQGSRGLPPATEATEQRPSTSESYVEDIDPRFAEPQRSRQQLHEPAAPQVMANHSYEDIPEGARSPAESERSTFTSISQRGINPRWIPPPSMMPAYGAGPGGVPGPYGPPGHMISRRPLRDPNEILLNTNPDFSLPIAAGRQLTGGPRGGPSNVGAARSGPGGNSMIPGSAYPAM
ncbi:pH signal transduction protein [Grosmannia clavigera kw1407]|uniref:pH signal transduction protein n=1 Tax=Grosmannia clavigera (strain kw1407 / UAMH 11150) TaxID=655863 RepID=F0XK04_GROCL|nr:pH signal transduction protein [Grosmannia clavigera kw1407]EFX01939.1 pH signal transduction protein [Grosmannia clavigera kw1407]